MHKTLRSLTLTVTERCNLRCAYCQVQKDEPRTMSPEIVDLAVELLARESEGALQLSFYGGEPFLARELVERAAKRLRTAAGARPVTVNVPTNALFFDQETCALVLREKMELTISLDGDSLPSERRDLAGHDATEELLRRLPSILALAPGCKLLARMTVTPTNVGKLSAHVRSLYRYGFRRIVFQPAHEPVWTDEAIATWGREHQRIGTWLVGLAGAGKTPPELSPWQGIEQKLVLGSPRVHCGAGVRVMAVAADGGLYPCYRFATEAGGEAYRLGDVASGITNKTLHDAFAALDPSGLRPVDGDCTTCASNDGCAHFCPASGALLAGDIRAVPAVVCRLWRAEVEAIRPYAAVRRRVVRLAESRLAVSLFAAASGAGQGV
jgi:uncharacterized protein